MENVLRRWDGQTGPVALHKQLTWSASSKGKGLTAGSRTKHGAANLIIIVIFTTTSTLYDIDRFPKAVI